MSGTMTITSADPMSFYLSSATNLSSKFTFSYTPFGANIVTVGVTKIGIDTVTDPTTHQTYSVSFTANTVGLGFSGNSGEQDFSIVIPAGFFDAVSADFIEYDVTLCEVGPNGANARVTEPIDIFILGTAPPPPPPPRFTEKQKAEFQSDANTLNALANALGDLNAATDPLHPATKLVGSLVGQLAGAIDPQVGAANAALQVALGVAANALQDSLPTNPIGITLITSAAIDKLAALLLQLLAKDPAEGNFKVVYQAPSWTFTSTNIPGASATGLTLLNDSWHLLQDAANALEASQRYQGAEYAGDLASQNLQNTAFNTAVSAYETQRKLVAADLKSFVTEAALPDLDLSTDQSTAKLETYLKGLTNPATDDPFLSAFIATVSSNTSNPSNGVPDLTGVITADVQQAVQAFLGSQPSSLTGSALAAVNASASELAVPIVPLVLQNEYLGIMRTALPLDQATSISNAIAAGTQTESGFIAGLLAQVTATTMPAVAVEASMYGVTGTSAEITSLVANFLPPQIANAASLGLNAQVYAAEGIGVVFSFGNERGSTSFATNFGPANSSMPNTSSGDTSFANAAVTAIFGSSATTNLDNVMQQFVSNWKAFFTANGVAGIASATADQMDLAARGASWGDMVGIALANNLGPLSGQVTNFLEDAAQGTAIYGTSLVGQPAHAAFA